MKENYLINESLKPLLDIDNDLDEMSKCVKIISSLKSDIEEIINKESNLKNNNENKAITLTIKDKHNNIKKQIQKFMNKKNYIYNFIRNESISNNKDINNNKNSEIYDDNEENEKLLADNKMENIMEKIKQMQNEIKNKINVLDEKLKKSKIFEKNENLIDEINSNEINDINFKDKNSDISNLKNPQYQSLLSAKAYKYYEENKELEKVVNKIEMLKKTTNHIKMIGESQGDTIENLKDINLKIENNIEGGDNELIKRKNRQSKKNRKLIISFLCLLLFLIIMIYAIYNKLKNK